MIVGLTGSIGMGKTTVGGWFAARGVPVFDSDGHVHALYAAGGEAVMPVAALVPAALRDGGIDRAVLSSAIGVDRGLLEKIEQIVHPLVRNGQRAFLMKAHQDGAAVAVLDIPLLFETLGDARVDVVVVVHAPPAVQRERVLARGGMTVEKFTTILAKQMPSDEKIEYADFVIRTDRSLAESEAEVDALVIALRERRGSALYRLWA